MSLLNVLGAPNATQLAQIETQVNSMVAAAIDRAVAGGATLEGNAADLVHKEVTGDLTQFLAQIFTDAQALESPIVTELQKFNATAADILDQVRWVAHGGVHISFGQPDNGTPQVKP